MKILCHSGFSRWIITSAVLCLVAGCATKKPAPKNYTMFPLPPDEPRIQYLWSYGAEADVGVRSKFLDFIVGKEPEFKSIRKPYGVAIRRGKIYVCDTEAANINIADLVTHQMKFVKPTGLGTLRLPINIAVDDDGTSYVTDVGRREVLIYDKDDNYLGEIGKQENIRPAGIALAGNRLYATDQTNKCVRVYDKTSKQLLFTLPRDKTDEKAKLFGPTNLAVDSKGHIYVSDSQGFVVKIYDAEGNFLRKVGEIGATPGQFALPKGIAVDHDGRLYVVDAADPVIQLFDADGKLLMFFGEPNVSGPGSLYLPAGIAVDYDNVNLFQKYVAPGFKLDYLILVVNQLGPNKVSVYGFLRKA
jgi:DNA-binding beta-propeller fold protein YncE